MKIICKRNIQYHESGRIYTLKFTVNKVYDIMEYTNIDKYWIVNDDGWKQLIDKEYFITLEEQRQSQLNKLIDE